MKHLSKYILIPFSTFQHLSDFTHFNFKTLFLKKKSEKIPQIWFCVWVNSKVFITQSFSIPQFWNSVSIFVRVKIPQTFLIQNFHKLAKFRNFKKKNFDERESVPQIFSFLKFKSKEIQYFPRFNSAFWFFWAMNYNVFV